MKYRSAMAYKKYIPLVLLFVLFFQRNGMSQTMPIQPTSSQEVSIVPDLSDVYVDKLIAVAKAYYPRVKSGINRINAAKAQVSSQKATLFTAISASYIYQPNQNATINPVSPQTSYFKGYQAGVILNFGTILQNPFLVRQAREQEKIAVNDNDEYLITIGTEVKKRYFVFLQRQAELKIQNRSLQDNENSYKDIKYRFEKGEEVFDVFNRSQISLGSAQVAKIGAEAALFAARADVEELIGTKIENIK